MKLLLLGGIFVLASVGMFSVWEGVMFIPGICVMAFGLLLAIIGAIKKDKPKK